MTLENALSVLVGALVVGLVWAGWRLSERERKAGLAKAYQEGWDWAAARQRDEELFNREWAL